MISENIPDYDSVNFKIDERHEDSLERKILRKSLSGGSVAVDLGGGYGRLTDEIIDSFDHIILIDYSMSNLVRAASKFSGKNVIFVASDIRDPPLIDESVDFIMAIRVIHHYSNLAFLERITSKLRDGGKFLFNFNNLDSPLLILSLINGLIHGRDGNLNPFRPGPQLITVQSNKSRIFFMNYDSLIRSIPHDCTLDKATGAGLLHNAYMERKAESFNLDRLTRAELIFTELVRFPKLFPDVFVEISKCSGNGTKKLTDPFSILSCKKCGGRLALFTNSVVCSKCGSFYQVVGGVVDMR